MYKDGGLTYNLPIKPLYDLGIRQFVVILLNHQGVVEVDKFPGSSFLIIKPSRDLGDLVTGTLDFTSKGAKVRMDLGYMDAGRAIRFFGDKTAPVDEITRIELRQFENKQIVDNAMNDADENISKLNNLINKYM